MTTVDKKKFIQELSGISPQMKLEDKPLQNEIMVLDQRELFGKQFKIYGTYENPLFLAKDVAEMIRHTDLSRMMELACNTEKLKRTIYVSGQNREMWFLTEAGLYEVLMRSHKPIAQEFRDQVKEILKTIRTTGGYVAPNQEEKFANNYFSQVPEEAKALIINALKDRRNLLENMKQGFENMKQELESKKQACDDEIHRIEIEQHSNNALINELLNELLN